jgi:hypothetical protein
MQDFTFKIDDGEKHLLEAHAARHGITLGELLRQGAAVIGDFSPFFARRLQAFCHQHRLSSSLVIENLLLGRLAELEARAEVSGESVRILPEFQFTATGPLTGDTLFTILKAQKAAELKAQKEQLLRRKACETKVTKPKARSR